MSKDRHYVHIPKSTLLSPEFKSLRPHARLLYTYMICKRHGVDAPFVYSYREIRQDAGFKRKTIASCIRQLERVGFLTYEHGGLEGNNNSYTLNKEWLEW